MKGENSLLIMTDLLSFIDFLSSYFQMAFFLMVTTIVVSLPLLEVILGNVTASAPHSMVDLRL
jgi:hypothetical protein